MSLSNKQFSDKKTNKSNHDNDLFSMRLNDAVIDSGLTRKKITEITGIGENLLSDYIRGAKAPSYLNFQKLAKALGVSYKYLLGEDECTTLENQEIQTKIGLSDTAIDRLKNAQEYNVVQYRKLEALNFIIENIGKTEFLENLYKYIFIVNCEITALNEEGKLIDISDSAGIKAHHRHGIWMSPLSGEIFNQIYYNQTIQDIVKLKEIYLNDDKNGETK